MRSHVKEIMNAKGVTVRALASETGLSSQTIVNARKCVKDDPNKKGNIRSCSLSTLARIAQGLGVSVHDLFSDQPDAKWKITLGLLGRLLRQTDRKRGPQERGQGQ